MSAFAIRGIPAPLVDHFWKLAEPFVKRALDHACGELLPTDLHQCCRTQDAQLWMISEGEKVLGAVITQIVNYPRRRHCVVITLGGSRAKEWLGDLDIVLCAWAKEQGCAAMEMHVRKGFVPILANYGGKHKYSSVFKDLS